jgi:membrane protease YdiL (CAAX protease family)
MPREVWLALAVISIVFTVAHFAMEYGGAPGVSGKSPVLSALD